MEYKNLVCSSCGGSDFLKLSELEYRCNHCHGLLVRTTPLREEPVAAEPKEISVSQWEMGDNIVKGVAALFAAFFIIVIVIALLPGKKSGNSGVSTPKPTPANFKVDPPVLPNKGKLQTEVIGRVKGRFGDTFIKCILTNVGDTVVPDPSTGLVLYKGDVKLDKMYGDGLKKFLKPGEKTTAFVWLTKHEDYTRAVVEENPVLEGVADSSRLFPEVLYIEDEMKIEKGTTIMNGQPIRENYYNINGIVTYGAMDPIDLDIYVVLTDAKGEIVGAPKASPPQLSKGERGNFEVSVAQNQLFGVPVKYQLVAVNRNFRSSSSAPAANKVR